MLSREWLYLLGEDFLAPTSQPTSDEFKLSVASIHIPPVNQHLLSPTFIDKKSAPKRKMLIQVL